MGKLHKIQFFHFQEQFAQNKTVLVDTDCFDNFQAERFKIDKHRDQLKETIDKIALDMIEEIKNERLEITPKSI